MAKIGNVRKVRLLDLKPYEKNARIHDPQQVEQIAQSIDAFGFLNPVLIDKDHNVIAGHGRIMAAEKLGMVEVPCLYVEGLSEEERRAYILADNRLTELGAWDMDIVTAELQELKLDGFDVELTGFELQEDEETGDWFTDRKRYDNANDYQESEEYQDFVEKFEAKKTTDDCYTPDEVYEAVAAFVAEEYQRDRSTFVRPFYPGGDYQAEQYAADATVVDNPPFSIISEIVRFYTEHGVKFFLFAPGLTLFSRAQFDHCTAIALNVGVTYENGACVSTSFLTNLEPEEICAKSSPKLYAALLEANDKARGNKAMRKYKYPDEVLTAPMLGRLSKYGISYALKKKESMRISSLDQQKERGDAIFGGGYLISQQAAEAKQEAEKSLAEREADWQADLARKAVQREAARKKEEEAWALSDREKEIVEALSEEAV